MGRIRELLRKSRSALASGTLMERTQRYVASQARSVVEPAIGYARLPVADRRMDVGSGFADHRLNGNAASNPEHLRRLAAAYRLSKKAQAEASPVFQIRGIWAEWIAVHYAPLIKALDTDDLITLGRLLENHYRESFTSGTGGYDNVLRLRRPLGEVYIRHVWTSYRNTLARSGYDMSQLTFPMVGNPAGVQFGGSVISIETLRHAYHALIIADLLRSAPNPAIVEIGGGLGGQCFQTMKLIPAASYSIFDIPEVAVTSGYFLLSAFGSVRLYGEPGDAAISVLPHFAITTLAPASADLFYNSCSFSEMDGNCSTAYLEIIEWACRRYFMHDNHELRLRFSGDDGAPSVNRIGSEMVPDPTRFRLVHKKPRAHGLPEDRDLKHFEYLYERRPE